MKFQFLKKFNKGAEDVADYIDRYLNSFADSFNTGINRLSIADNIDGIIIKDIIILAGEEKGIPHNLGVIPSFRLILRQAGNSLITDGSEPWTNKEIYLKNNGANDVTLTISLMR